MSWGSFAAACPKRKFRGSEASEGLLSRDEVDDAELTCSAKRHLSEEVASRIGQLRLLEGPSSPQSAESTSFGRFAAPLWPVERASFAFTPCAEAEMACDDSAEPIVEEAESTTSSTSDASLSSDDESGDEVVELPSGIRVSSGRLAREAQILNRRYVTASLSSDTTSCTAVVLYRPVSSLVRADDHGTTSESSTPTSESPRFASIIQMPDDGMVYELSSGSRVATCDDMEL